MKYRVWRGLVFVAALIPSLLWIYQAMGFDLGPDPAKTLLDRLGLGGLMLLLITLSMTPLWRLTRWMGWMAVRRQLGLWAFAYALLHMLVYAVFLLGLDGGQLLKDLQRRPYILIGALALLVLLILAVTSNRFCMRKLGKRWKRLHRSVYAALILIVLHMFWVVRADLFEWLVYACLGLLLLLLRVPFFSSLTSRAPRGPGEHFPN